MDNNGLEEQNATIERLEVEIRKLSNDINILEQENRRLNNEIGLFKKLVAAKDALLVKASKR